MMKNTLSIILAIQISLGSAVLPQVSYAADNEKSVKVGNEVMAPAQVMKTFFAQSEYLFGPDGPAILKDDGEMIPKENRTTSDVIQGNGEKKSINTYEALKQYSVLAKAAQQIWAGYTDSQREEAKNSQCTNCGAGMKAVDPLADLVPQGAECSLNDKRKVAAELKANPKCTIWNEAIGKSKSTSKASCWEDLKSQFNKASSKLVRTAAALLKSGSNSGDKKFFKSLNETEKKSSKRAVMLSGMSEKDYKKLQTQPAEFKEETMRWLVENIMQIDAQAMKEISACSGCGHRLEAFCRMAGIFGKDFLVNAMILKITAGVIVAGGYMAKGAANVIGKRGMRKAAVAWGRSRAARISSKLATGFQNFAAKNPRTMKIVMGTLRVSQPLDEMAMAGEKVIAGTVKRVKGIPSKIKIDTGDGVATEAVELANAQEVIEKTPIIEKNSKGNSRALASLEDASDAPTLRVSVSRPETPEMIKSKKYLAQKVNAEFAENAKNATRGRREILNQKSIAVQTNNPRRGGKVIINVPDANDVRSAYFYDEGHRMIVPTHSGKIHLIEDGRVVKTIHEKEAAKVQGLLGKENNAANRKAVMEAQANAEANGTTVITDNREMDNIYRGFNADEAAARRKSLAQEASKKYPDQDLIQDGRQGFVAKTGPDCGNQAVSITPHTTDILKQLDSAF